MKPAIALAAILSLASCGALLQSPAIPASAHDTAGGHGEFDIVVTPLTLARARAHRSDPYPRSVVHTGIGAAARLISESSATRAVLPPNLGPVPYRLGLGDELTFAQFIEGDVVSINELVNSGNGGTTAGSNSDKVLSSVGRVGSDGSVLLLGLGKLELGGKTLSEARDVVRNVLIRNGIAPKFQLEITGFNSKKIFLVSNVAGSKVVPLTNQGLTLRELVASTGQGLRGDAVVVIRIQRGGREYRLNSEALLRPGARDIYLRDQDQVILEAMGYKPAQVYVIGGITAPTTVPIKPETRETLADVLFTPGGIYGSTTAQRSEVYLLRGTDPVQAFKLDATDATSLVVASNMELRPNDIIFVPERPISEFNRALLDITPLRLLLRDIAAKNIP